MKAELKEMLKNYKQKAVARKKAYGLLPRPLTAAEVEVLIKNLTVSGLEKEEFSIFESERVDKLVLRLLSNEVRRGTFPASYKKAEGLAKVVSGELSSDYLSAEEALELLAAMQGGAATGELITLLEEGLFEEEIIEILKETVLVNQAEFERLTSLAEQEESVQELLKSWAHRDFAQDWELDSLYPGVAIKVGDNLTTGHLSPSKNADSRTDHPRHAQFVMDGREDEADFMERLEELKTEAERVIFVAGEALGEGSSRKSATYTMLQLLGEPVEGEPEKKAGGVVVAKSFAPIFKNSLVASGILPIEANTELVTEGDSLEIDLEAEKLVVNGEQEISITLPIEYKLRKIAAGGMTYFDAGNELQQWAVSYCQEKGIDFDESRLPAQAQPEEEPPAQTLAQKIVGFNRLDDKDTILPGETAPVRIRGVYSQDTTGPMTLDEYQAMAGGDFGAEFVVQSLCHTGECPSSEDRDQHRFIDDFVTERGGVCLEPGEGIIHTIGNQFVLPTDVIVGGDSHTRTPRGVSFPAASDIVAGAMKYGKQDLTMDESVRVIFKGEPQPGITARDLVSTLVVYAEETVGKEVYNGRIIEMEGLEFLDSDERYILTNAVAERSASAGTVPPDESTLATLEENLQYLKSRADVNLSPSVQNTIQAIEEFLAEPVLLEADADAQYAATIEIPLAEVEEPLVAKPHHPDNVAPLSEIAGTEVDEVFIGSCVGGDIESIRAAARIVEGERVPRKVNFVVSPASRDIYNELANDGSLAKLTAAGATVIMPGCGLCMGNKRRIGSGATAFTTTTRNYQARIGPADSQTYLGSAHVAAMVAVSGEIPTVQEYFQNLE
ncbi:bifunctional aconitate hydratase 2/2-methylisocitrate dehydratase [Fuchsiella alkaliacetigena]|uniref:bifunctional aconitate hydratase 2/2-methylisocitrate dehydratase n=1 Tax=Fuchsiella alkaliacetigena TaxID=957042 RepID=UPI00200AD235|nr:bifunctional aconitate hydratase 2/2-methylisocitrate dehydratase [Fuchsiella alkaliacetigena]MCK8825118.1 bifunctional aconitate hydratase 2/2-methylisocitrate dehydratase [Fuchsiella alkaliacetigena]